MLASQQEKIAQISVSVATEVANYINNRKRRELARLEEEGSVTVQILGAKGVAPEYMLLECRDEEGREVKFPVA
jgi:ribonuclease E